jgi:DNA-binding NarL/FixJ family response regulator
MAIHIFLVEDHEIVRQGIRALLGGDENIMVIGEASNGREALEKMTHVLPDIVLMDMNMPEMNGQECTRALKALYPDVKVLILSMHDDENYLIEMLEAGADGYILKNSSREELLFAIRRIVTNGLYIASEFTLRLLKRIRRENDKKRGAELQLDLSERDLELIDLIAEGLTNQEIAERIFSSVRTVETRRKKLLDKTGAKNTASLIRFAVNHGIIT